MRPEPINEELLPLYQVHAMQWGQVHFAAGGIGLVPAMVGLYDVLSFSTWGQSNLEEWSRFIVIIPIEMVNKRQIEVSLPLNKQAHKLC